MPASRRSAAATPRAGRPQIQLLSPPGSLAAAAVAAVVPPDERYGPGGTVRPLVAYDAGLAPPPLPADAPGHLVGHLGVDDTTAAVVERLAGPLGLTRPARRAVARRARTLLEWLAEFDGDTWEQRWLASGADAAPRGWAAAAFPDCAVPDCAVPDCAVPDCAGPDGEAETRATPHGGVTSATTWSAGSTSWCRPGCCGRLTPGCWAPAHRGGR